MATQIPQIPHITTITLWLRQVMIFATLAASLLLAIPLAQADVYDDLRLKRRSGAVDTSDPDIAQSLAIQTNNAQLYWDTMDTSPNRSTLWQDQSDWSNSGTITESFSRLSAMASMYRHPSSSLYGNPGLAAAIHNGYDWMMANHYNPTIVFYDNWWDWQIGTPKKLGSLVAHMYEEFNSAQLQQYLTAIDHFTPDPTTRLKADGSVSSTPETGANRLDKAYVVAMRGILGKSASKIAQGRDAISEALVYVTADDGFYLDGSFIQHHYVPYQAGYGMVLLDDIANMLNLLKDSEWQVSDPNVANVFTWAEQNFRPFVYDGAFMDAVKGRGISRQFGNDHKQGRSLIAILARLAQSAPAEQAERIRAMIKGWVQRDHSFGASYFTPTPSAASGTFSTMPLYEMTLVKAMLADPQLTPSPEPLEARLMPSSDRAVMRGDGFGASLSMFSKRISAFEYGNGENKRGWWTGAGMLTLYNADQNQYTGNYWATIDMLRLPGTTTDRSGSGTPASFSKFANTRLWTGGTTLGGRYATLGMDYSMLNVTGSALTGKKAWFFFGDKIIALGAAISGSATNIETIVENRKLGGNGDQLLTVDGQAQSTNSDWSLTLPTARWAHLADSTAGADIGYYFPDAAPLSLLRETRNGTWNAVNIDGTNELVSDVYQSLALSHGTNPSSGSYTYVILPNRTAAATAAFAAAPGLTVLERSSSATAVRDTNLGLTGINFWNDSSKTVMADGAAFVTSNLRAAVLTQERDGVLDVSVSDPTQINTGSIIIEINRVASTVLDASPGVTILQLTPTIKLSVAVGGTAGAPFSASFRVLRTLTLNAVADAYVRDGSYANNNFGLATTMMAKSSTVGYSRQNYTMFDLSGINGTVVSAQFRLSPNSVGQTSAMTHDVYQISDNTWTETALTWNNRPANGSKLGSWLVPSAGNYAALDVSAAVSAALGSIDKRLTLHVEAAQNYGSTGWADYSTREGKSTQRPQLVVSYY